MEQLSRAVERPIAAYGRAQVVSIMPRTMQFPPVELMIETDAVQQASGRSTPTSDGGAMEIDESEPYPFDPLVSQSADFFEWGRAHRFEDPLAYGAFAMAESYHADTWEETPEFRVGQVGYHPAPNTFIPQPRRIPTHHHVPRHQDESALEREDDQDDDDDDESEDEDDRLIREGLEDEEEVRMQDEAFEAWARRQERLPPVIRPGPDPAHLPPGFNIFRAALHQEEASSHGDDQDDDGETDEGGIEVVSIYEYADLQHLDATGVITPPQLRRMRELEAQHDEAHTSEAPRDL